MRITEIAFTSYPVTDLKRARRFYESTLGLTATRTFGGEEHGAVEYDIGTATLCIANVFAAFKPSPNGGMIVLEVADFDIALTRLREHQVALVFDPYESTGCRGVAISDPDGNSIMIHKRK